MCPFPGTIYSRERYNGTNIEHTADNLCGLLESIRFHQVECTLEDTSPPNTVIMKPVRAQHIPKVREDKTYSPKSFEDKAGIRQGYILSPILWANIPFHIVNQEETNRSFRNIGRTTNVPNIVDGALHKHFDLIGRLLGSQKGSTGTYYDISETFPEDQML